MARRDRVTYAPPKPDIDRRSRVDDWVGSDRHAYHLGVWNCTRDDEIKSFEKLAPLLTTPLYT